jgi:DNA-binding IclR family transcriptional regulator
MSAGTQSIENALALWRDVAHTGDNGARLTDLATKRGLNAATVRRTLLALVRTGWFEQDSASRRYRLGAHSVTLSAVSSRFSRLQHLAQSLRPRDCKQTDVCNWLRLSKTRPGRCPAWWPKTLCNSRIGRA